MKRKKVIFYSLIIFFVCALSLRLFSRPILSSYSFSKVFRDRHGKLLRVTLSGDQKYRIFTPLGEIDPKYIQTVLVQEDRYFYRHPGINPVALIKAVWDTFLNKNRRGASTITMQLCRLLEKENTRSVYRKIRQITQALALELSYSKNEILEAYLNLAPMGGNIEGVGAASLLYFNHDGANLKPSERIALALIPQSPVKRSLHLSSGDPSLWKKKRAALYQTWRELHPDDKNFSVDVEIEMSPQATETLPFRAPHFVEQISRQYPNQHRFQTSLDLNIQTFIEKKVAAYVRTNSKIGINNSSVLLMDYQTGEVISYLGSANFFDDSISGQVDGIQAMRSPGSTLKPFVYALAMDEGLIHSETLLRDTPKSFGTFDPENFDRIFLGPLPAKDALINSRNIPAVELSSSLKKISLYDFLKSQDFLIPRPESYYGLGLTLGGAEVKMEDLLRLYAGLARAKALSSLQYFKYVPKDSRFPDMANPLDKEWAISPESAWMTLNILSQNPRLEAARYLKWSTKKLDVAWKTGTSSGFRDAWTLGVFGPYALAVWVGNFSGESNPAFLGREAAAPLFFEIAEGLWEKEKFDSKNEWNTPTANLNVKEIEVCSVSGGVPETYCPHRKKAWFIPGVSPIAKCSIHKQLLISKKTGLRACAGDLLSKNILPAIFEVWPTDLLEAYKAFGIYKKAPPEFDSFCALSSRNDFEKGAPPEIISPRKDVTYAIKMSKSPKENLIPFQAIVDGDAHKLDWFSDSEYLGESTAKDTFFWQARRGKHLITVVDDLGRSRSQWLEVKYVP